MIVRHYTNGYDRLRREIGRLEAQNADLVREYTTSTEAYREANKERGLLRQQLTQAQDGLQTTAPCSTCGGTGRAANADEEGK